jgi:hypothetical protein
MNSSVAILLAGGLIGKQPASQVKNSSPDCHLTSKSHDRENRATQVLDERHIDLMESNNEHNWLSLASTKRTAAQRKARNLLGARTNPTITSLPT